MLNFKLFVVDLRVEEGEFWFEVLIVYGIERERGEWEEIIFW